MINKIVVLCISLLALSASANPKDHSKHTPRQSSLVAECLPSDAMPSVHCGRAPTAAFDQNGDLLLVFSQNGHIYLVRSADKGNHFSPPVAVNTSPEAIYDDGENRPKILLGKQQEVFVSWTHKTPGRYSGDVRFARSLNGGVSFEPVITVNSDKALISHRFDAMAMDAKGRIYLTWIDKRDQTSAKASNHAYKGAAFYYAISTDSGATFLPNQKLFDHSCECCRIALDTDNSGNVVALWRHIYPDSIRDHAISYIDPDNSVSSNLLPPRASLDHWKLKGCPHHGPDLSVDQDNTAHMVWFTKGDQQKGLIYGQFNLENQSRKPTLSIDDSAGASRPQVMVIDHSVFLMWKHFNGTTMELRNRRSLDGGQSWSENQTIATTENDSDHPDWIRHKAHLYAAWQTRSEGYRLIPVPR